MPQIRVWQFSTVAVAVLGVIAFVTQRSAAAREHAALRTELDAQTAYLAEALPAAQQLSEAERREAQALLERRAGESSALAQRVAELTERLQAREDDAAQQGELHGEALRTAAQERERLRDEREQLRRRVDSLGSQPLSPDGRALQNPRGVSLTYYGPMVNGKATGFGIGFFETGAVYRGEWKDNMRHGRGVYRWADGDSYDGEFVDDRREGQGTYQFRSGERYVGAWQNDVREGYGEVVSPDGDTVSRGIWRADRYVRRASSADSADSTRIDSTRADSMRADSMRADSARAVIR